MDDGNGVAAETRETTMRCILIDRTTGTVQHDTADIAGKFLEIDRGTSLVDIAKACDASVGEVSHRSYTERPALDPTDGRPGYLVYRIDVGGSEVVGLFSDACDKDYIADVQRDGEYLGFVEIGEASEVAEAA